MDENGGDNTATTETGRRLNEINLQRSGLKQIGQTDPNEDNQPIASRKLFVVGYALYNVLLIESLVVVAPASTPEWWSGSLVALLMGAIAYFNRRILINSTSESDREETKFPPEYLTPLLSFGGYLLLYTTTVADPTISALMAVAVTQASLSAILIGVYSRPFVPDMLPEDGEEKVDFLEHHLSLWWRSAQITLTFLFAIGVSLAASSFSSWRLMTQTNLEQGGSSQLFPAGLGLLILVAFIGILALGYYALAKFHRIGREIKSHYVRE